MYANNKNKIHSLIFIMCIFFYMVSPDTSYPVRLEEVQAKEAKTETGAMASWVVTQIQVRGKEDWEKNKWWYRWSWTIKVDEWKKEHKKCDAECKIKTLKDIGIRPEIAESLVTNCKKQDIEVVNCIKLWASIVVAESWWWKRCNKNWCFGILAKVEYNTVEEWVEDWVNRFWKYWLNQKNPSSFYSNSPDWKPKTRYCMSERQPDGSILPYCKNWYNHAWSVYNKIKHW